MSLGTLDRNLLWHEPGPVRTAHATTSLIVDGDTTILVDPGLPAPALAARLAERTPIKPADIDIVFLTTLLPHHRAGIELFGGAQWVAAEAELLAVAGHLKRLAEDAADEGEDVPTPIRNELAFLGKLRPADDKLSDHVDLFPLPGATPGTGGLLLSERTRSILLCGPAVATRDHFLAGQVLPKSASIEQAQESLREVYEIADAIVPGYDNVFDNPRSMSVLGGAG